MFLALNAYEMALKIPVENLGVYDEALRKTLGRSHVQTTLQGFTDEFHRIHWNPQNHTIATVDLGNKLKEDNNGASIENPGIEIWDADTGKRVAHLGYAIAADWSPDGKFLATGQANGNIEIKDLDAKDQTVSLSDDAKVGITSQVFWSPDAKFIADLHGKEYLGIGSIRIWNVKTKITTVLDQNIRHETVAWSPDGKKIATTSKSKIFLWNPDTGENIGTSLGLDSWITSLAWSPDGKLLVSGFENGTVAFFDAQSLQPIVIHKNHSSRVCDIAWSPDGEFIASASEDSSIGIWDAEEKFLVAAFTGHTSAIRSIDWSPDGKRLVSASSDRTVRVWNIVPQHSPSILQHIDGWVWDVAWNPSGSSIATASDDGIIRIIDINNFTTKGLFGHQGHVTSIQWSPDGQQLASSSRDKTVRIWNIDKEKPIYVLDAGSEAMDVAWNPDGKFIASSALDGMSDNEHIKLWNTKTGENVGNLDGVLSTSIAWSPDGKILASGNVTAQSGIKSALKMLLLSVAKKKNPANLADKLSLSLWDLNYIKPDKLELHNKMNLNGHDELPIWGLAWSPDGKFLASASDDKTAKVWNVKTGKSLFTISDHSLDVKGVAWSPDGKKLATASLDKTIRLWDMETGKNLAILSDHTSGVRNIAWSPDGRQLVSASEDGTVRLFSTNTNDFYFKLLENKLPTA